MVNVRKDIIENKVYCEIIFRLGTHSHHANSFVEQFTDDLVSLKLKEASPHKTQPVLARQMAFLHEQGWLNILTEEDGKKLLKNMKKYSVNFDKIISEFIDYTEQYFYSYRAELVSKKNEEDSLFEGRIKELKSEKFREQSCKNVFVQYFFRRLIEEPRHLNLRLRELTMKELFDLILRTGMFQYLEQDVEYEIAANLSDDFEERSEDYQPMAKGFLRPPSEKIRKHIPKDRLKEWDFFAYEFLSAISIGHLRPIYNFMSRDMPRIFSDILLDGLPELNLDFYGLPSKVLLEKGKSS